MSVKKINMLIVGLAFSLSILLVNLTLEPNAEDDKIQYPFISFDKKALAQEVKWTNYTIDSGTNSDRLSTTVPPGWQITEDRQDEAGLITNTVVFVSPKDNPNDLFQENIVLSVKAFKNNVSSEDSVNIQDIIGKLRNQYEKFEFENMSKIKIDSISNLGDSIVYRFEDSGLMFKTKQVFLSDGKNIFIFSLLAEQKEYDKYVLIFDQVLKSIHSSN